MTTLTFEQIKSLVHGAAIIEEGDGKISFFRFTKEQQSLYKRTSTDFYNKTFASSGISLEFDTDSEHLSLSVLVSPGSSRSFFTHSIYVNGERFGELSGNVGDVRNVPYTKMFALGKGPKRVKILFPWSVYSALSALQLDDGASASPITKPFKMLMFGDSITQGYDAMRPENAYAIKLSDFLNAEAINKGIAGEQFFAGLGKIKETFKPDLITVAYGTNDWRHATKEKFLPSCKVFFENLRDNYPDVPIVALTPLWRVDINNRQEFGEPLSFVTDYIKQLSFDIPDMTVLDCSDFIPHEAKYYQTDGVHPLDSGFEHYAKNLMTSEIFKSFKD